MIDALDQQRSICAKYNSEFVMALPGSKTGLAMETLHLSPIYGVREHPNEIVSGWFIWAGPYSKDPDFYQPCHTIHLQELLPIVIPYLGLAPGYKFIIDTAGYEDVWFETLKQSP